MVLGEAEFETRRGLTEGAKRLEKDMPKAWAKPERSESIPVGTPS